MTLEIKATCDLCGNQWEWTAYYVYDFPHSDVIFLCSNGMTQNHNHSSPESIYGDPKKFVIINAQTYCGECFMTQKDVWEEHIGAFGEEMLRLTKQKRLGDAKAIALESVILNGKEDIDALELAKRIEESSMTLEEITNTPYTELCGTHWGQPRDCPICSNAPIESGSDG